MSIIALSNQSDAVTMASFDVAIHAVITNV